jgi:predicted DNA-binding transcriptional regulator AlpA
LRKRAGATISKIYRLLGRFDLPREISVGGELYK